ncbi:MAG: Ldh family oxidoreductase [Actinobacteria bacterium]|nr:Ldh family oxidoreductase [Actinomycetota bacterium]MSW40871.1 Ldh family oxidoreductase [Actinomycetota bacterium]
MSTVPVSDVLDWSRAVLVEAGLQPVDAGWVAESLVFADLRGVNTHGVMRLPTYVARIRAGGIARRHSITVQADLGALVLLDGGAGAGASIGVHSADLAIERARTHGIGAVITKNANHFGACSFYTNRIADAGMLGIVACNTESVMCAPFGGAPVLGTNPIAIAVPMSASQRPQVDMATTTTSQGRLLIADHAGESIPTGWAVDAGGQPTTSASEGLRGALLPAGGPKGFGLAFAVDALLALAGANVSTKVYALGGDPSEAQRLGHLAIAIRADGAQSLDDYRTEMSGLVASIHASSVGLDVPAALAPGEPELARESTAGGRIPLSPHVIADLALLALSSGVAMPSSMIDLNRSTTTRTSGEMST